MHSKRYTTETPSCSWLLLRHFAQMASPDSTDSDEENDTKAASDEVTVKDEEDVRDVHLPGVSFDVARRLMTRTDFIEPLDHLHVSSCLRKSSYSELIASQIISIDVGLSSLLGRGANDL